MIILIIIKCQIFFKDETNDSATSDDGSVERPTTTTSSPDG